MKHLFIFLFALLAFSGTAFAQDQDTLVLKDGSKVRGVIVKETKTDVKVKIRIATITYKKSEILEIIRAERDTPPATSSAKSNSTGASTASTSHNAANGVDARDILILKGGKKLKGLIVSQDRDKVVFDIIKTGAGVSKLMTLRSTFSKKEVQSIKEITPGERKAVRDYISQAKNQSTTFASKASELRLGTTEWETKDGRWVKVRKIELDHFIIESNVEDDFLRKLTGKLKVMFSAYKDHFGVYSTRPKKVRVLIYNSMPEFYHAVGGNIKNPAFYHTGLKWICAGCDYAQYKIVIGTIKNDHDTFHKELQTYQTKIKEMQSRLNKQVAQYHEQIKKQRGLSAQQKKSMMNQLSQQQSDIHMQIGKYKDHAKELQKKIRAANVKNNQVFKKYTQHMLATIYHEAFHAFADLLLFDEAKAKKIPRWLHEGLAQYFEMGRVEANRLILGQVDSKRMNMLREWSRKKTLVAWNDVINGKPEDYIVQDYKNLESSHKHYTQSWWMVHWMGKKGRLNRDNLEKYMEAIQQKKDGYASLPILTGVPIAQMEKELANF